MTEVRVQEGEVLTRADAPALRCLVIQEGTVSVRRNGREVARLGEGAWTDEGALRSNRLSKATTVALTDLTISPMHPAECCSLAGTVPSIADAMPRRNARTTLSTVRS